MGRVEKAVPVVVGHGVAREVLRMAPAVDVQAKGVNGPSGPDAPNDSVC